MSARNGLGLLPFSDYADPDPHGQLRIGTGAHEGCRVDGRDCVDHDCVDPITRACEACGAEPGEECRPMCIGLAAHLDGLPLGDS